MHINGAPQMMQSANMGVVPGAMPVQGPGQGPVPVGQGPVPVGPPGKRQSAFHTSKRLIFEHHNDVDVNTVIVKIADVKNLGRCHLLIEFCHF